mgnify:CR=1 FL=1
MKTIKLREFAYARTGDKGDISNVSVIPYNGRDYDLLVKKLDVEKVKKAYDGLVKGKIEKYEFPGVKALNFVMWQALDGGVSKTLCLDLHGKARESIMLDIDIEMPDDYTPPRKVGNHVEWSR